MRLRNALWSCENPLGVTRTDGPVAFQVDEQVRKASYVDWLPLFSGLHVPNEFLCLAPIYFYNGEGHWLSGSRVLTERSFAHYVTALANKIRFSTVVPGWPHE